MSTAPPQKPPAPVPSMPAEDFDRIMQEAMKKGPPPKKGKGAK